MRKKDGEQAELTIAKLLSVGVLISAAFILVGLIVYLATGSSGYDKDLYPTNPMLIIEGLAVLKPYSIILTGIFLLILTPIFRVGLSIIIFIKEKDKLYVVITAIVFAVLIVSMVLGKTE